MIYLTAAEIIDKVKNKEGSIKTLVYNSGSNEIKSLYALVCETLKYSGIIQQILAVASLLQQEKWLKESVANVLTYDLLFGKGIKCRGKFKRIMKRHQPSLEAALADIKKKSKVKHNKDLLPKKFQGAALPRYVRVNRLKQTPRGVEEAFKADGYECVLSREEADEQMSTTDPAINSTQCIHRIRDLQPKQFMADLDLHDVFVFAPGTDLHANEMFKSREIILQDKASCIPAAVLAPPTGSHVIDSCAAPGNKTSQLASIMGNTGQIFAYDCTPQRYKTMCKLTPKAGVTNTEFANMDFLKTDPNDKTMSSVEYILVDPSCSGTGMVDRRDHLIDGADNDDSNQARLANLASVQLRLLNHALSFPNVKRVVYSTCSVHAEENEQVVMKALAENAEFELKRVLPTWGQSQGLTAFGGEGGDDGDEKDAEIRRINDLCLHAVTDEHLTNGFFAALFERKAVHLAGKEVGDVEQVEGTLGKKKKKLSKRKQQNDDDENEEKEEDQDENEPMDTGNLIKSSSKKTKKKRKSTADAEDVKDSEDLVAPVVDTPSKTQSAKKKKKRKSIAK